jgi:hypothetical protein
VAAAGFTGRPMDAPAPPPPPGPRVIVCTFASEAYAGSAEVLRHSALREGGADEVVVYREADVAPWFEEHPELLRGRTRGHGWWSWKPWCVRRTLDRHAAPGDVVVYCDAAMAFEAPLAPYVAAARHVLLFRLGGWAEHDYTNRRWTKRDAFTLMGMTSDTHADAVQVNAALQLYRHTPQALAFLDDYLAWCRRVEVLDDDSRALQNDPGFRDHRHDQSVVSLLAVGHPAVAVARDPTQWGVRDPADAPGVAAVVPPAAPPLVDHHRRQLRPPKVAVITPTVGTRHLEACIASVQAQSLPNVEHYVVVDGPAHAGAVEAATRRFRGRGVVHVLQLPRNVGADGWNGHR